jgi:hypothetical protein
MTAGSSTLGGKLLCASQLVRVTVCRSSGWSAANTWLIAPPVSFATRSMSVSWSASQNGQEASESRRREVLVGRGWSLPVQRQVDRYAPAPAVELIDHVAPQTTAGT